MTEKVILVDEGDNAIGTMEKMEAHRKGMLHRAFSVILFNADGEMLLQRRAAKKYHSGGLWTNTCCSHPLPNESTRDASRRRLMEEMGINLQPTFAFKFIYKTDLDHDLVEHEYDHVYIGAFDGIPVINKTEVDEWKFMNLHSLRMDIIKYPGAYTEWFKLILNNPELNVVAA
jgi:isopentenyl-diphosphate delta-isomerase